MFKMGCTMARKILGPNGSAAASNGDNASAEQQAACFSVGGGGGGASSKQGKSSSSGGNGCKSGGSGENNNAADAGGAPHKQKTTNSSELDDFTKLEEDPRIPLNVRQIFKITKSWKAIARTMSKTGTAMFLNLFEQNADLFYLFDRFQHLKGKDLHESMELREHAATVMSTLDTSINSLSDYDNFVTYLHSIGELHRKVPGFKREYFWKIEQPFMKAVKQTLDERCNETIEEIYKIAIKLIIETIADGYGQDTAGAGREIASERRGDEDRSRNEEGGGYGGGRSGDNNNNKSGASGNVGGDRIAGAQERESGGAAAGNQRAMGAGSEARQYCANHEIKQINLETKTITTAPLHLRTDYQATGNKNIFKPRTKKRKQAEEQVAEIHEEEDVGARVTESPGDVYLRGRANKQPGASDSGNDDCKAHLGGAVIAGETREAPKFPRPPPSGPFCCRLKQRAPVLMALKSIRDLRCHMKCTGALLARLAKRLPGSRWTKANQCANNKKSNQHDMGHTEPAVANPAGRTDEAAPLGNLVSATCELLQATSKLIGQRLDLEEQRDESPAGAEAARARRDETSEAEQEKVDGLAKLAQWRDLLGNLTDREPDEQLSGCQPAGFSTHESVHGEACQRGDSTDLTDAVSSGRASADHGDASNQETNSSGRAGGPAGTPAHSDHSPASDSFRTNSCCPYAKTTASSNTDEQRPCASLVGHAGAAAVPRGAVEPAVQQRTSEPNASDLVDFIKLLLLINKLILTSSSLRTTTTTTTTIGNQVAAASNSSTLSEELAIQAQLPLTAHNTCSQVSV